MIRVFAFVSSAFEAVLTIASGAAASEVAGSVRDETGGALRYFVHYFGPCPLVEDAAVNSQPTALVNIEGGYRFSKRARLAVEVFNLLDTAASDMDYYYVSRLSGEPRGGVADVHFHPTVPRTARVNLRLDF
jgi:outer membrane receptor protein involved in Fe transport